MYGSNVSTRLRQRRLEVAADDRRHTAALTSASLLCYAALRSTLHSKTRRAPIIHRHSRSRCQRALDQHCLLRFPPETATSTLLHEKKKSALKRRDRKAAVALYSTLRSNFVFTWPLRKDQTKRCHQAQLLLRAPPCRPPPSRTS